jgi:hypothetical protein
LGVGVARAGRVRCRIVGGAGAAGTELSCLAEEEEEAEEDERDRGAINQARSIKQPLRSIKSSKQTSRPLPKREETQTARLGGNGRGKSWHGNI